MRLARVCVSMLLVCPLFAVLSLAAVSDRITGEIAGGPAVTLAGNVHGLARPEFDLGRAEGGRIMNGVSLVFQPSPAQRAALDQLLAEQQDPASPKYHRWLTPTQFADRFGMTRNDIKKVSAWLQSAGLRITRVANSRNQIFFEGTAAQIESIFQTEIHNYLVDGEIHYANATDPVVPQALAGIAQSLLHLHNFQPKPHVRFNGAGSSPDFTSHLSGNHFLAPGDFATIYNVQGLYNAGATGAGQQIAIVGQSEVNLNDISHFRSAAGLNANVPTLTLVPNTGSGAFCRDDDELESDLDIEWSAGVAQDAAITFFYAGLATGDTCGSRQFGAFDALQYAIDQTAVPVIPIISNSYGDCEAHVTLSGAQSMQLLIQQANTQGQTVISASGDSGAADCDYHVQSATHGLAVDIPAAIPEVIGAGGNEFSGDASAPVANNNAAADSPFWSGTNGGSDTLSSALMYISETGWNDSAADIAAGHSIASSGGGASIFFSKPAWQTGTLSDGKRDVPDIALNASADHDGYLFCSEDNGSGSAIATCTTGFRDASSNLDVVGGTSAAAPTFAGILALVNQYVGNTPPAGLGNFNKKLYAFAGNSPSPFHDVTTGNNIVPCTTGTTGCTSGSIGFSAGAGYDQVTGLGSVNAFVLAQAEAGTVTNFSLSATTASPASVSAGNTSTSTITITPQNGFNGTVSFSCSGLPSGATCIFNPTTVISSGTTALTIQTYANGGTGASSITVTGKSGAASATAPVSLTVTATTESFTLTSPGATLTAIQGAAAGPAAISVNGTNGFVVTAGGNSSTVLPITYTCTNLPPDSTCTFGPNTTTPSTQVTLTINTTAPIAQTHSPFGRGAARFFYAACLPGLFGFVLLAGSRRQNLRALRMLGLMMVLGVSALWMASCTNQVSNSNKNPGTTPGAYVVTVNGTTGGANPVTSTLNFNLTVTAQ